MYNIWICLPDNKYLKKNCNDINTFIKIFLYFFLKTLPADKWNLGFGILVDTYNYLKDEIEKVFV